MLPLGTKRTHCPTEGGHQRLPWHVRRPCSIPGLPVTLGFCESVATLWRLHRRIAITHYGFMQSLAVSKKHDGTDVRHIIATRQVGMSAHDHVQLPAHTEAMEQRSGKRRSRGASQCDHSRSTAAEDM